MSRIFVTKKISREMKILVAYEQGYKCNICQKMLPPTWQCDYIIPLGEEGSSKGRENLQALCVECYLEKELQESTEHYELEHYDMYVQKL